MSEITLGAAKRNTESGAIFDAKEAVRRAEQEAERSAREVMATQPGFKDLLPWGTFQRY